MTLYEELSDERGDKYRRPLGVGVLGPDARTEPAAIHPDTRCSAHGDTLILETHNGDNPPD